MPNPSANVKQIFGQALDIESAGQRQQYLDEACQGNRLLRAEVEDLMHAVARAGNFLAPQSAGEQRTYDQPVELVGTSIGPYKLLEQIGEGGMGLVYMAEQQRPLRRLVALKLIKPGMDSKQVIARFEAEKQALAMMDHENIAKVFEAGTTDTGRFYFAMELVRGIPINEFCDQKRLSVRERLALFIQVCQAVQHAHQKGIIHRDLKPSNVLVTMNDVLAVPKVIDFGIAKALGQQLTEHTLHTGFAQLVGTPLYMSPEQAEMNQLGVDTRSDVYSLGVLLYELLTGTTPFDKERLTKVGLDELRRIIREEEPETVSVRLAKTLSRRAHAASASYPGADGTVNRRTHAAIPELDWIVIKALEKDRTRRYESPSALAADIQRYLNGDLVHACPPSPAYRFRKFAKKNKAALTTAALLAASLLLGTTLSLWQAIRATAAEAQATANEREAKEAAAAETKQRQRAEMNFAASLEAVDRMLANVNDPDLNDVPRVGPLRRKMLKDAIAFYERIPIDDDVPADVRLRVAETWQRIGVESEFLNEVSQAQQAFEKSLFLLGQLVSENQSQAKYRLALARSQQRAGWFFYQTARDNSEAEKQFRRSSELLADLAINDTANKQYSLNQAHSLEGLAVALSMMGKQEEATGIGMRAVDLIQASPAASGADRANTLAQMAKLRAMSEPAAGDDLLRRAIDEYRQFVSRPNSSTGHCSQFAALLRDTAKSFATRHPDEAEKLWDESISRLRQLCAPAPRLRSEAEMLVDALRGQARHLRRLATNKESQTEGDQVASRLAKAQTLFQEAIARHRQILTSFAVARDKPVLVELLQEDAEFILRMPLHSRSSADKLRADALVTEAIQLCRALAAEFPDNQGYKSRLAALLKLHTQHFGQEKQRAESNDK